MKKKQVRIFILFLVLNLIPHVYAAIKPEANLLNWYLTDDAFYYFKVAQNISEGYGVTFDNIAPTNGFHPLWMLVCVPVFALARFDLFLPLRVLIVVQALLNAASGYFLFRLLADNLSEKAAWVIAFLWMFLPSIHGISTKLGLETGLNVFAIIFLFFQTSRLAKIDRKKDVEYKDLVYLSLAAILALFSRLDNIFIVVMLGCWLVFRRSQIRWISQGDFLLILISTLVSYYSRIQSTDNIFNFLPFAYMLIGFSLVLKPVFLFFLGSYELAGKISLKRYLIKTAAAMTLACLTIGVIFFVLHDLLHAFRGISRAVLILDWLLSTVMIVIYRFLLYKQHHNVHGNRSANLKENWREWLTNVAAYFVPLFGSLAVYMVVNKSYFGSAMPVSGQIKRWWGKLPNTVYGRPIKTLAGILSALVDTNSGKGPFWMLMRPLSQISKWIGGLLKVNADPEASSFLLSMVWIIFAAIVLIMLIRRWKYFHRAAEKLALLPFFTGCFFHAISYKATGYLHAKYWYWLGEMVLIVLFWGILLSILFEELGHQSKGKRIGSVVVFGICALIAANFGRILLLEFPIGKDAPVLYDYEADFDFLEGKTSPGDVIGMTGGGLNSYFMPDRTFVNLDGLINNAEYFESLKNDQTDEYLASIGLDYVYGEELILLDSDPYRWIFTDRLRWIGSSSFFNLYEFCSEGCQ